MSAMTPFTANFGALVRFTASRPKPQAQIDLTNALAHVLDNEPSNVAEIRRLSALLDPFITQPQKGNIYHGKERRIQS